jgi:hypothetical protein
LWIFSESFAFKRLMISFLICNFLRSARLRARASIKDMQPYGALLLLIGRTVSTGTTLIGAGAT